METALTRYALGSRIIIILLQYVGNVLIPDHDAGAFLYPQTEDNNYCFIEQIIHHLLGGFIRWDAQYFMHIAKYGYTYENTLAFFPLYPLTVRYLSLLLHLVFPWLKLDTILLLIFIGLNTFLFIFCVRILFKLTAIIFNMELAYKSALLFCFNPASIFFSAPYSECIFCYLTLLSILNCIKLYKKYYEAMYVLNYCDILLIWPICLSTVTRSNGLLNIGFLIYTYICLCKRHWSNTTIGNIKCLLKTISGACILTVICLIPFSIYQIYCYHMFCKNHEFKFPSNIIDQAKNSNFVLPGQFLRNNQSWCYDKIPLAYVYVQKEYWNVGFLQYYELKQLPNFLLAAPILTILVTKSCQHLMHINRNILNVFSFDSLCDKKKYNIFNNPALNVFVIHILFLSLFSALCVHVQVSTRMLCSASPIFYWFCASLFINIGESNGNTLGRYCLILYFLSYFFIGTVLFSNFLPWT